MTSSQVGLLAQLVRALHRYRGGQGSNPGKPDFFRLSFRNCISCVNNCEDLLYIYFFITQFKYMNFIYIHNFILNCCYILFNLIIVASELKKGFMRRIANAGGLNLSKIQFHSWPNLFVLKLNHLFSFFFIHCEGGQ